MNKSESKYFNTAKKMNEALVEILEHKPFEYITISEICEKAGVNRSTFYLHYENTSDLLLETSENLIDRFLSYFQVNRKEVVLNFKDCDLSDLNYISDDYLHPYLSYIYDNRHLFQTAIFHLCSFKFDDVYKRLYEHIFNPILDRFEYPISDRKYVMAFYLNGINSIILEWLNNDCKDSITEIERIINECIYGLDNSFISHLKKHINKQDHLHK